MCEVPFIKVFYGAYESNGIIKHKPQRLHGIIQCLTKLGYEIEIVPSLHINKLTVEMFDREIYRCDIRNLMFNIDCDNDKLCERLVRIVEEAASRFYTDENLQMYCPLSKGKRAIQQIKDARTTQDLLSSDVKLWFEIPKNSAASFFQSLTARTETEVNEENNSNVL